MDRQPEQIKPELDSLDRLLAEARWAEPRREAIARLHRQWRSLMANRQEVTPQTRSRGLTRRQRMVLAGLGTATAVGLLLAVAMNVMRPASALERMAENIRQAKSLKAAMIAEHWHVAEPGRPPVVSKQAGIAYWLATKQPYAVFVTDHEGKTTARQGVASQTAGLDLMERLGQFSGRADGDLGTKQINGKPARGFQIEYRKLFAQDAPYSTTSEPVEVWTDAASGMPVVVQFTLKATPPSTGDRSVVRIQDFQWNVDLDPKLFDTATPKDYDYTVVTSQGP